MAKTDNKLQEGHLQLQVVSYRFHSSILWSSQITKRLYWNSVVYSEPGMFGEHVNQVLHLRLGRIQSKRSVQMHLDGILQASPPWALLSRFS
jgi:hypothetical protein